MRTLIHHVTPGSVILSPMAGFSDSPFRNLTRRMGSAVSITEFVSTDKLFRGNLKALRLFRYLETERPIIFQVFGNDPEIILKAVQNILPLKPDGIDLNIGCSARCVAHAGSGAGLLRHPLKIKEIIQKLVKNIPLPISAKIRLGWDEFSYNYLEVTDILESEGVWAVAVHGRTKKMGYTGKADWDKIGEVALARKIPVFGNGDIKSYEQAQTLIKTYNLNAVYVGRSAIGNPWLFSGINRQNLNYRERLPVVLEHLKAMSDFYGTQQAAILFRKHLTGYFSDLPEWPDIKHNLYSQPGAEELGECLFQGDKLIPLISA